MTDLSPQQRHERWKVEQHETRSTEKRLASRTLTTEDGTKITTPHLFDHVTDAHS